MAARAREEAKLQLMHGGTVRETDGVAERRLTWSVEERQRLDPAVDFAREGRTSDRLSDCIERIFHDEFGVEFVEMCECALRHARLRRVSRQRQPQPVRRLQVMNLTPNVQAARKQ